MFGLIRPIAMASLLTSAALAPGRAEDSATGAQAPSRTERPDIGAAVLEGDLPEPFVPLHPRTAEQRDRIEALQDYMAARALEDQLKLRPAIDLLEQALRKDPDSVAILRRLARLCDATGRIEQGVRYARRAVEVDPSDSLTIGLIVKHYFLRDDPAGAETFLRTLLENPRLDPQSPGSALLRRDLGFLYAESMNKPEQASEAFAQVIEFLDATRPRPLSEADVGRVLGEGREAESLTKMGIVLYQARRFDLAARAFRRGLEYAEDDSQLSRLLVMALKESGRPQEALDVLEPLLRRAPDGAELYELLAEVLTALDRKGQVLPRLEEAARVNRENIALQYLLADRYREAGRRDKADALYQQLIATHPDPTGAADRVAHLLREKRTDELIAALGNAYARRETADAIRPLIESIALDPQYAEDLLDAGLKLQQADPPKLDDNARKALAEIATKAGKLEKLLPIQKMILERNPNPRLYREFWNDLYRSGRYDEAASALDQMLERFPDQKDAQILTILAQTRMLAGRNAQALEAVEEALTLNPTELYGLGLKGTLLARLGRQDDAFGLYEDLMKRFPDDIDAMQMAGELLGRLERNDQAIAHYRMLIDRFGDNELAVKKARLMLSLLYSNLERFDEAEKELEILYEAEPDDAHINNDLGYMWADRGKNLERAEAMIRKAVAEEPDNPSYLDSLGWVLHRLGKSREAIAPLEKAAASRDSDATIHDHLGDVYFKLKEFDKARDQWREAERAGARAVPPDRRLPEIRRKLQTLEELDEPLPDPADSAPP